MLMCCSTRYGHLGLCVTFAVKRCLLDILAWGMQPLRIRMPTKLHAMVETSLHSSVPAEMMTLRFLLGPVVSRTHDQPLLIDRSDSWTSEFFCPFEVVGLHCTLPVSLRQFVHFAFSSHLAAFVRTLIPSESVCVVPPWTKGLTPPLFHRQGGSGPLSLTAHRRQ